MLFFSVYNEFTFLGFDWSFRHLSRRTCSCTLPCSSSCRLNAPLAPGYKYQDLLDQTNRYRNRWNANFCVTSILVSKAEHGEHKQSIRPSENIHLLYKGMFVCGGFAAYFGQRLANCCVDHKTNTSYNQNQSWFEATKFRTSRLLCIIKEKPFDASSSFMGF